jgi:ketopantoate reductase
VVPAGSSAHGFSCSRRLSPLSGRNSTYRLVQISGTGSQQGQLDGTYDVVLLTCKSYDLDDAMGAIAPAMGERSVILPVLNGVRHIDVLTAKFGPRCVVGGLTTRCGCFLSK